MAIYVPDRAVVPLTTDQIGRTQSLTPEGFLLCEGVRIARTGPMLYLPSEVPEIEPDPNGSMVTLVRDADVLFSPETMASFLGKPVTNDHPEDILRPDTWRQFAGGTVLNVRRGEGAESEYLLADLLITDAQCIKDVQSGKREVSCGYDTGAETVKPGLGRVTKIVGNHVALVDRGRCGPACAIQDEDPTMAKAKKRTVWDRLVTAFHAKDEAAFKEELESAKDELEGAEEEGGETHVHVHLNGTGETAKSEVKDEGEAKDPTEERFAKIEASIATIAAAVAKMQKAEEAEAKVTEGDEEPKASEEPDKPDDNVKMDAAVLSAEFRDTISRAEILAPGLKLPTFDAKAKPKLMVDAMCGLRRKALKAAFDAAATKPFVVSIAGEKPDFTKMTCDHAAAVFRGASELVKSARSKADEKPELLAPAGAMTAAKMQERILAYRKGSH